MREAMLSAPLGDDVFGDDPTVNALQEHIAQITGKEAALFMPSGTQSNLCALMAHCERGDEYIVGQNAHTYRYEGGGAAVFAVSGIIIRGGGARGMGKGVREMGRRGRGGDGEGAGDQVFGDFGGG